ncbi:MAG: NAD-dependent deacetylase [Desulfuromonas sp.]|nr:MAG: NAD-dependent deacetylase [Desulfuromonas sp.]
MSDTRFAEAADAIATAEAMVITAGAGMGVDSGLPDFRGNQGFWNAYPMYERLGLSFVQAANPEHFESDPHFGWGFYGHRTNLYRSTVPHAGFSMLKGWIARFGLDHFIVTSNVDGQFQKAGFEEDRVLEVHGSIHHLQCTVPCSRMIWPNTAEYSIDETTMRTADVPHCPRCKRVARPNILMFGDYSWLHQRTADQEERFDQFLTDNAGKKIVVIEMGAGTAIPTIRHLSERLGQRKEARVIRINPREPQIHAPHFSFAAGAVATLDQIAASF